MTESHEPSQYLHDASTDILGKVDLVFNPRNDDIMLSCNSLELPVGLVLEQQRMEWLLQTNDQPQRSGIVVHYGSGYSM